jgi:hypothetical protein
MQNGKKRQRMATRDEALKVLRYVWKDLGVAQREFAAATGLNQGSISKILNGSFRDVDGRAYEVWKYATDRAKKAGYKPRQPTVAQVDARLAQKINQVWDRTAEGADALIKLLDAADQIQKRRA